MARPDRTVMGKTAAAPRLTRAALWLAFRLVVLPLLVILVLFDVAVWWVAKSAFGVCAAVWCWF